MTESAVWIVTHCIQQRGEASDQSSVLTPFSKGNVCKHISLPLPSTKVSVG